MRTDHLFGVAFPLLCSAALALGACGDDTSTTGSEGTSGTSEGMTTTGSSTTTVDSADTTDGPMETTVDPMTSSSTTTPMTESETSSGGPVAFRFNSIELTDPGAGLGGPCGNADMVNGLLAGPISSDEDGDGNLDMAFVIDFPELDQTDGSNGMLTFANAACAAPDGNSCGLLMGTEAYVSMYSVMTEGTCLEADPVNIEPGTGNTGTTTGPCFVTDTLDAEVVTSAVALPLSDARIAAQFVGDPAGNLVSGTLEGFLSADDAANTFVEVIGMMIPLDTLLCAEQMDGEGWWMHMNFTAITTEWTG